MTPRYLLRVEFLPSLSNYLIGGIVNVNGNALLTPPRNFNVKQLPSIVEERVHILSMMDNHEGISNFGEKVSKNIFYVLLPLDKWEEVQLFLSKEDQSEKIKHNFYS